MNKTLCSAIALVLVGFVAGSLSSGVRGQKVSVSSEAQASGGGSKLSVAASAQVQDAAVECGAYGLPGSPASVTVYAGADGRVFKASLESDIFGGEETESCVVRGVSGVTMAHGSERVVLPVYNPDASAMALAAR